ncbi:CpsD/CapB family tyrosine-protein kinase [Ectobacillus antri]|uniref:non-specific protein-tyrosine kinase n=1 Tax=Ectobacillus antri TaxID=2486280 RepID=A0ABT6H9E3_9BACI|nr:CpsD/CapB family tyrosine-protein kinase [Ectobacillus antri]MDG4658476.1 CpsD/CapB family tyrosine-protein kinase [Ectobacillus antri]MDG5755498.1 CpsD/CapB family tyrosine-protein kinase [Ectobacillus antri]
MVLKRSKPKKHVVRTFRQLITYLQPKSPITEQYRNIRTNIQFAAVDGDIHSIVVTSSTPGEGKTTTAANLGVVFAQQGKQVIVVDADFRRPTLHTMFRSENTFGLTTVLAKQATLAKCILQTEVENLKFLPSGAIPPNPAELLGSKTMDDVMAQLKETFDIIILDTPPLLAVTDAQVLSNKCDGTVLVVRSGKADKDSVLKVKAQLTNARAKLLGVVLNAKAEETTPYYYYSDRE